MKKNTLYKLIAVLAVVALIVTGSILVINFQNNNNNNTDTGLTRREVLALIEANKDSGGLTEQDVLSLIAASGGSGGGLTQEEITDLLWDVPMQVSREFNLVYENTWSNQGSEVFVPIYGTFLEFFETYSIFRSSILGFCVDFSLNLSGGLSRVIESKVCANASLNALHTSWYFSEATSDYYFQFSLSPLSDYSPSALFIPYVLGSDKTVSVKIEFTRASFTIPFGVWLQTL